MVEPLFNQKTLDAVNAFANGNQHALILITSNSSGIETLINRIDEKLNGSTRLANRVVIAPESTAAITIDQTRRLKRNLSLKTVGKSTGIVIINPADSMTQEAQNSLLKVLEEPAAALRIILVTKNSNSLLETIRSRSQMVHILPVAEQAALAHFASQLDENLIKRAYALSDGQPGDLYELISTAADPKAEEPLDMAKQLLKQPLFNRLVNLDQLTKNKQELDVLLETLQKILQAATRNAAKSHSRDTRQLAMKQRLLLEVRTSIKQNGNSKLAMTDLLINL